MAAPLLPLASPGNLRLLHQLDGLFEGGPSDHARARTLWIAEQNSFPDDLRKIVNTCFTNIAEQVKIAAQQCLEKNRLNLREAHLAQCLDALNPTLPITLRRPITSSELLRYLSLRGSVEDFFRTLGKSLHCLSLTGQNMIALADQRENTFFISLKEHCPSLHDVCLENFADNLLRSTFDRLSLSQLDRLTLRSVTLTGPISQRLTQLPKLRELCLDTTHMCAGAIACLPECKELTTLSLAEPVADAPSKEVLTDDDLLPLAEILRLKNLSLAGLWVTDKALNNLARCSRLTSLSLIDCPRITGVLTRLYYPKLEELFLTRCRSFTSLGINAFLKNCPRLSVENIHVKAHALPKHSKDTATLRRELLLAKSSLNMPS